MSRIADRFAALARDRRGALIPFLEAWYPDGETSMAILHGLPDAGADLIEIGMPFSDPVADGPIIQAAAKHALAAGATVVKTLAMVRDFRREDAVTPVILMGYLNPILAYGERQFCQDANAAGVDGLIVVDMPPEEFAVLAPFAADHQIDLIRLVAPTTSDERLPVVLGGSTGFIYYVAIRGITGTGSATAKELRTALTRLRRFTTLPIAVGFGVRTPRQAADVVAVADAAVVASALIQTLTDSLDAAGRPDPHAVKRVLDQVRALAAGVREARPA